ncbi:carboxypeptidase Y-deficient [Friedmanniomyces endolithicus]|nr:carboxypeptidase Y-deficient [Friedmanniomyces endolithicus]KAK0899488.1 carboxypeptidase Y-deficient [Friedmanniomyces endolithicus]
MATRRSLGGGRVLGTGKSLAPPAPPTKQPVNNIGLLSPSESSVSLNSQVSSTPLSPSLQHEDLTAQVALDGHASAQAAAAASSRMVCPICNEEMVGWLSRPDEEGTHIDDNHGNLEEVEQDEAKTWFKNQMVKTKKFQPLQLLNQKLRGLDIFESNNEATPPPITTPHQASRGASPTPPVARQAETPLEPDEVITKSHWQRATGHDACSDPMCGKRLGTATGQVHCRHCGRLFCDEHTMYQMKLSRSAKHEPVRGLWYRVCETCYKTRDGYNDKNGAERNHLEHFKSVRRRTVDKQYLETSRLEMRLTRLTQLLADPPPPEPLQSSLLQSSLWSSLSGGNKNQIRVLEQTVVPWQEDASVNECPFCRQPFSQYSFRRHHCRTCGRVVCSDPATACSTEIGLDVDISTLVTSFSYMTATDVGTGTDIISEKGTGRIAVNIRLCKDCQRTIFSKADFARVLAAQTPDQRAYQNLVQFEHGIRLLLPRFQRLLLVLQDPAKPPTPSQLAEASKVRKRLTDSFTQYDFAARRMRDLPADNPTQQKLQNAVYQQSMSFLHVHMLPLKSLPKILKHAALRSAPTVNGKPQGALASLKYNDFAAGNDSRPSSSRASSTSSAQVTALEAEEKELRERLIVLEEQKFFVSEMIADANKRRKFDEVAALAQNVEDLSREVDQIQGQLSQMDFAGAYANDGAVIK